MFASSHQIDPPALILFSPQYLYRTFQIFPRLHESLGITVSVCGIVFVLVSSQHYRQYSIFLYDCGWTGFKSFTKLLQLCLICPLISLNACWKWKYTLFSTLLLLNFHFNAFSSLLLDCLSWALWLYLLTTSANMFTCHCRACLMFVTDETSLLWRRIVVQ